MTNEGRVNYDILVLATGVTTNYYGNKEIEKNTYSLKSVADALYLRNAILADLEKALTIREDDIRQGYPGSGHRRWRTNRCRTCRFICRIQKIHPAKEYPELDAAEMDIHLIQGGKELLRQLFR